MRFTTTLIALFASVINAAPLNDVSARQVDWSAVGELYSGGGCTSQTLIFADPIFGAANVCHPLDRFGNQPPIVSYKTVSTSPGCTVALYFDLNCTVPATGFPSPLNQCTQGNSPFESAIVTCPN